MNRVDRKFLGIDTPGRLATPQNHDRTIKTTELIDLIGGNECTCKRPDCQTNVHHLYWTKRSYSSWFEKGWREIPLHKVRLPICQHERLHRVTEPPTMPEIGVMKHGVEEWVALSGMWLACNNDMYRSRDTRFWSLFTSDYLDMDDIQRARTRCDVEYDVGLNKAPGDIEIPKTSRLRLENFKHVRDETFQTVGSLLVNRCVDLEMLPQLQAA